MATAGEIKRVALSRCPGPAALPFTDPPGDLLAEIANLVDHCGKGRDRPFQY